MTDLRKMTLRELVENLKTATKNDWSMTAYQYSVEIERRLPEIEAALERQQSRAVDSTLKGLHEMLSQLESEYEAYRKAREAYCAALDLARMKGC